MRKWIKLGCLYQPKSVHPKLTSHAANPLAVHLTGDIYRIFYSGRDVFNRSSVGYVDADILRRKVVYVHDKPVYENGASESFYSHGVSIGNCFEIKNQIYVGFMGWQWPANQHWRGQIGRFALHNHLPFSHKVYVPYLALSEDDNISLSYPFVMKTHDSSYLMWYGSTVTWDAGNGEMLHVIKYATSVDGEVWHRKGIAVPYELGVAQAFSRPSVIEEKTRGYHMWFSYRGSKNVMYRIGYAFSKDGMSWDLQLEDSGIDVSKSGWDSEMIEYPFVFKHKDETYLLYNGNGYGKSGFGLAIAD